jgi:hypothetical protein
MGKMKLPPVGWAFFGLTILIVTGYVLNRGLFIGSEVLPYVDRVEHAYSKHCRYLFFTGTQDRAMWPQNTHDKAGNAFCSMFYD